MFPFSRKKTTAVSSPKEGKFVEHGLRMPVIEKTRSEEREKQSHRNFSEGGDHKEKRKNIFSLSRKKITFILLALVAILGWSYVGLFSDICSVQKYEIEGIKQLTRGEVVKAAEEAIRAERVWPFHEGNIFFLPTKEFAAVLKDHLFVQSVIVDKIYPNILRLKIEERKSSLILQTGGRMFEVDRNGMVTRSVESDTERSSILNALQDPAQAASNSPVLTIDQDAGVVVNNPILDQNADMKMQEWLDTFQMLSKKDFGYRSAELETVSSTKLIVHLFEPYDVYFDLLNPLEPQIQSYAEFARTHRAKDIQSYVDARIPGKVFYK